MQYPQIQFYRGSLVRLASGKLKQVEDLDSDDFLESARLVLNRPPSAQSHNQNQRPQNPHATNPQGNSRRRPSSDLSYATTDENNNSVFNSPEPTPGLEPRHSPASMEVEDLSNSEHYRPEAEVGDDEEEEDNEDDDEELVDVVSDNAGPFNLSSSQGSLLTAADRLAASERRLLQQHHQLQASTHSLDDLSTPYIDSSVVKDFLEVGPAASSAAGSPSSSNTSSPADNLFASCSTGNGSRSASSSSQSLNYRFEGSHHASGSLHSPPATTGSSQTQTVLIKFFLESSRRIVFIEVPIERPFFVFHRGWSSWNPQKTYEHFGLKCRKLKIGDTCISLIRTKHQNNNNQRTNHHQSLQTHMKESDQCNILFSSIKLEDQ